MKPPRFLTTQEVVFMHEAAVRLHGGAPGIRDAGLLDSAVHMPQATFGGDFLHPTVFHMAAAYLFYIAANHAFVDGNKRTAWLAARMFLRMNGYRLKPRQRSVVSMLVAVATGEVRNVNEIAAWISAHVEQL